MVKYIFFDIDNTIYTTHLKRIDESIPMLFEKLIKKGYVIGIATGRGLSAIDCISPLKDYISYYVLANGMGVYDKDFNPVFEKFFSKEQVKSIFNIATLCDVAMGVTFLDERGYVYQPKTSFPLRDDGLISKELLKEKNPQNVWFASNNQDNVLKAYDLLLKEEGITPFLWNARGIDISLGTNKKTGVLKIINPEKDKLIFVGDGANDLEVMKIADLKIVMSTTKCKELIEIADHVVSHSNSSELYNLFEKLEII